VVAPEATTPETVSMHSIPDDNWKPKKRDNTLQQITTHV
jgi:hypothetical protein